MFMLSTLLASAQERRLAAHLSRDSMFDAIDRASGPEMTLAASRHGAEALWAPYHL